MPTSGEALLARKKKAEEKPRSLKSKKIPATINSRLPVAKKKSTLNKGKENAESHKPLKARPAPDFSKLHSQWNNQLQKGKAVVKKTNTKVKPFVLTENHQNNKNERPEQVQQQSTNKVGHNVEYTVEDQHIEDEFKVDPIALQGILSNTGIKVEESSKPHQRATIGSTQQSSQNTVNGYSTKRASIYYTGNKENRRQENKPQTHLPRNDDNVDDDEISFKPDAKALESILNNKGIDNGLLSRHTMASTRPMALTKRQSIFDDNKQFKRTSIYYNGNRTMAEASRLSLIGRPHHTASNNPSTTNSKYTVGSTVVGFHNDKDMQGDNGDDDEISFKPDAMALESILNNKGIDSRLQSRHTMASTRAMAVNKRQPNFDDNTQGKRTSIYYTGSRTARLTNEFSRPSILANKPIYTVQTPSKTNNTNTSLQPNNTKTTSLQPNNQNTKSLQQTNIQTPSSSNHTIPSPTKTDQHFSTLSEANKTNCTPFRTNHIIPKSSQPNQISSSLLKPNHTSSMTAKPQYFVGSTLVGYQDTIPFKQTQDDAFAKPLLLERQKEQHAKPSLNIALATPSRSKKQVTWSEILTPHRDQQTVVPHKGGSILKMFGNASSKRKETTIFTDGPLKVNQTPVVDSMPIAMKLFTDDDTATILDTQEQLKELELQAMHDLELLDLEQNTSSQFTEAIDTKTIRTNKVILTPSIDISGCAPLTSPPNVVCTPSTHNTPWKLATISQRNTMDQIVTATPENHMRVTVRTKTPQNSNTSLAGDKHQRLAQPGSQSYPAPTPIKTPVRMPIAFGLLSSIKKHTASTHKATGLHPSSSVRETFYSSTPGIDITALWDEPSLVSGAYCDNLQPNHGNYYDARKQDKVILNQSNQQQDQKNDIDQKNKQFLKVGNEGTCNPLSQQISDFKNGVFMDKRSQNCLKRNRTEAYTNDVHIKSEVGSLSLRLSLKPKVRRVQCITPVGKTENSSSELVNVKNVVLPSSSLTEQALLDAEVTLYTALGKRIKTRCSRNLANPLTKLFEHGDSQHLVPVCLCTETINCPQHIPPSSHDWFS